MAFFFEAPPSGCAGFGFVFHFDFKAFRSSSLSVGSSKTTQGVPWLDFFRSLNK
jgi:hypothetical protein